MNDLCILDGSMFSDEGYPHLTNRRKFIYMIFHDLLSGIENKQLVGYESYLTTNHGIFFLSHVTTPLQSFHPFLLASYMQMQKFNSISL